MNCSFWPSAGAARARPRTRPASPMLTERPEIRILFLMSEPSFNNINIVPIAFTVSVGKRPEAQLLLSGLPEARQTERLDRQKEDDQRSKNHQLEVGGEALTDAAREERMGRDVQEDGQQHDEGCAEEGAEHAPETADDDHEQNLEGASQIEGLRLDGTQVRERPERAGH